LRKEERRITWKTALRRSKFFELSDFVVMTVRISEPALAMLYELKLERTDIPKSNRDTRKDMFRRVVEVRTNYVLASHRRRNLRLEGEEYFPGV
jgi:hypothetical protein